MAKSVAMQNIALVIAAAGMVAALHFLYNKTQAIDLREQNEILGYLRELKDIDSRWDIDVLRARSELATTDLPRSIARLRRVKRCRI